MTTLLLVLAPHLAVFLALSWALHNAQGDRLAWDERWQWWVLLRVPLFAASVLLAAPVALVEQPLLANAFVIENRTALLFVGGIGALAALTVIATGILGKRDLPARMGVSEIHPRWNWMKGPRGTLILSAVIATLLLAPLFFCLVFAVQRMTSEIGAQDDASVSPLFGVGGALAIGVFIAFLVFTIVRQLVPLGRKLARVLFFWVDIKTTPRWITDGYFDEHGALKLAHLTAALVSSIFLAIYALGALWFDPNNAVVDDVPVLGLLLLIFCLATSMLSGAAFFLDRLRVPLVTSFVVLTLVLGFFSNRHHHFSIKEKDVAFPTANACLPEFEADKNGKRNPIYVVCAEGGGIQAAAWTARVLLELDWRVPSFTQRLALISSVSGGSVGAMHFVEQRRRLIEVEGDVSSKCFDETQDSAVIDAAMASSLGAAGSALVLQDFRRGLGPFSCDEGRGTAIEAVWRRSLGDDPIESHLGDWADFARRKELPVVCFNATMAGVGAKSRSGQRMLFSTATGFGSPKQGGTTFDEFFGKGYDLSVVTAARLSATFPYISPIARADESVIKSDHQAYGVGFADGGYADNTGFTSALQWLLSVRESIEKRPVIFIMIEAFPGGGASEGKDSLTAWQDAVTGPLQLLFKARTATQRDRVGLDEALLSTVNGLDVKVVRFRPIARVNRRPPPLSWHLDSAEQNYILKRAWGKAGDDNEVNLKTLVPKPRPPRPRYQRKATAP